MTDGAGPGRLYGIVAASIPVAFVGTMSWFGTYTFVNAYVIRGLGGSNQDWTLATLWYPAGMVFWYLVCTEISSRIGRRWTTTLGLAATTFGYAALALGPPVHAIPPILAVMGLTTVGNAVAWTPMIAEAGKARPGQALALSAFVGTAVSVLALLGGGGLIAGGHFARTFAVISGLCAVSLVAFHVISGPLEGEARSQVTSLWRISRADLGLLARGPFLVLLLLGVCMDPFSFHTMNQLAPNLARDLHGFAEGPIGLLVALGRIPALLSLYGVSRVIDRLNVMRCYAIGLLLDGVATVAVGAAQGRWALAGAYLVFYLVHGLVWGTNVAAINKCLPPRLRDSGFAISWLLEILAVFLVGVVHNRLLSSGASLVAVFGICGAILAATSLVVLAYASLRVSSE
jgi:MFS family permease